MHANQIPVLSFAAPIDKDNRLASTESELTTDTLDALFSRYGDLRRQQARHFGVVRLDSAEIADVVAFTDPNDLLSYFLQGVETTH